MFYYKREKLATNIATAMVPVALVVSVSANPGGLQGVTVCSAVWAVVKVVRPNEAFVSLLVDSCNVCVIQDILANLANSPVALSTTSPVLATVTVK